MATATIGDNTGNTYSGTDDTHLPSYATTTNYGTEVYFAINKYGVGDHTHGLLKFTGLSSISGPVTVSAATLYLYSMDNPDYAPYNISFYRCLRNWVESQATWNIYSTGNNWTTAGAVSDGNDKSATLSVGVTQQTWGGVYTSFTSAELIADVQDMINNPATNYGWVGLRGDAGEDSRYTRFISSEGTDTQRPYLDITYTSGGGGQPLVGSNPMMYVRRLD